MSDIGPSSSVAAATNTGSTEARALGLIMDELRRSPDGRGDGRGALPRKEQ
ncbi:MAG: hypothetical protein ACLTSG_00585 [Lachnospiraceae bacterium]